MYNIMNNKSKIKIILKFGQAIYIRIEYFISYSTLK